MAMRIARERGVDPGVLDLRQMRARGFGILFDMGDGGGFWDRKDGRPQREKCERHLARGGMMRLRDLCKQATSGDPGIGDFRAAASRRIVELRQLLQFVFRRAGQRDLLSLVVDDQAIIWYGHKASAHAEEAAHL